MEVKRGGTSDPARAAGGIPPTHSTFARDARVSGSTNAERIERIAVVILVRVLGGCSCSKVSVARALARAAVLAGTRNVTTIDPVHDYAEVVADDVGAATVRHARGAEGTPWPIPDRRYQPVEARWMRLQRVVLVVVNSTDGILDIRVTVKFLREIDVASTGSSIPQRCLERRTMIPHVIIIIGVVLVYVCAVAVAEVRNFSTLAHFSSIHVVRHTRHRLNHRISIQTKLSVQTKAGASRARARTLCTASPCTDAAAARKITTPRRRRDTFPPQHRVCSRSCNLQMDRNTNP